MSKANTDADIEMMLLELGAVKESDVRLKKKDEDEEEEEVRRRGDEKEEEFDDDWD